MEDTISILRGTKERYEVFHGVKITGLALVAAAVLLTVTLPTGSLPDKAIDLVDEGLCPHQDGTGFHADRAG